MSESWRKAALLRRVQANCPCGEPATVPLYLHYRRPREQFEPEAADPWNVHGSYPVMTCGAAGCEADFYAELAATFPDATISAETDPGAGIFVDGDDT